MRKLALYILIVSAAAMVSSCSGDMKRVPFEISGQHITAEAAGGEFSIALSSSDAWSATSDNPWITVSPANGPASAMCQISVDSTVVSGGRSGIVRFRNRVSGQSCDLKVDQDGYGNFIIVNAQDINVRNYAGPDSRHFEVDVRSNVPFEVVIPASASKWLSVETPEFNFDRGARPRDTKLKFTWNINSVPMSRETTVSFKAIGSSQANTGSLHVSQDAAPEIVPGHAGDSTVIVSIARNLGMVNSIVTAEPMSNWDNVLMWEEGDEGYTPEKKGRVKAAGFQMFATSEEIPYEVQYLTEVQELVFFSNVNSFMYELSLGEHICKLTQLKALTVSAYGLYTLPEEMKNLRNLEYLDISCNNFDALPDVLTKENFPNLTHLMLNTCQRSYILDLSNTISTKLGGFQGSFPKSLLEWENLESLRLSVNFLEGSIPDMLDYPVKYTPKDCEEMNLPPSMIGKPKVLPKAKYFAVNLNRLSGNIPDWILYHPNLTDWDPYSLCYPQEGRASDGKLAGFKNIPVNMNYYWTFYDGYKEYVDIYLGD